MVLGSFQEALGVAITQDVADLSGLNRELNFCYIYNNIIVIFIQKNRDYHLEAFNSLVAPGEDPLKTNCFQLLSVHLENPSAPLNFLNSLFSLHNELDYMITLLPRWHNFL